MGGFSFTKQERRGIIYISILLVLSVIFRYSLPYFHEEEKFDYTKFDKEVKAFENSQQHLKKEADLKKQAYKKKRYSNNYSLKKKNYKKYKKNKYNAKYYTFDPNTATLKDWQNFGFSKKQTTIIVKYIKKSGGIYSKSDLKNIFVINEKKYRELYQFININQKKKPIEKNKKVKKTELNTATSEELQNLKGIGKKTAERILKYKDLLGGFSSLIQLNEVYGISEENYQLMKVHLKVNRLKIKKININFSDKKELAKHPYITFETADKILKHKLNKGSFKSVNELYTNNILTDSRLRYYLTIE